MKSSDIHIRAISQEMPQPSVTKIRLKITYLKFHLNLPVASELIVIVYIYIVYPVNSLDSRDVIVILTV